MMHEAGHSVDQRNEEENPEFVEREAKRDDGVEIENDDIEDMEQLRKNYLATLDASIDLLVRNSLCSSLVTSNTHQMMHSPLLLGGPSTSWAYQTASSIPASVSSLQSIASMSNGIKNPIEKNYSAKSSKFTIENLIKK